MNLMKNDFEIKKKASLSHRLCNGGAFLSKILDEEAKEDD